MGIEDEVDAWADLREALLANRASGTCSTCRYATVGSTKYCSNQVNNHDATWFKPDPVKDFRDATLNNRDQYVRTGCWHGPWPADDCPGWRSS